MPNDQNNEIYLSETLAACHNVYNLPSKNSELDTREVEYWISEGSDLRQEKRKSSELYNSPNIIRGETISMCYSPKNSTNTSIIAFKGTSKFDDLVSDRELLKKLDSDPLNNNAPIINSDNYAKAHLIRHIISLNLNDGDNHSLIFTGHSLGGRYAQIAQQFLLDLKSLRQNNDPKLDKELLNSIITKSTPKKELSDDEFKKLKNNLDNITNNSCITYNSAPLLNVEVKYRDSNTLNFFDKKDILTNATTYISKKNFSTNGNTSKMANFSKHRDIHSFNKHKDSDMLHSSLANYSNSNSISNLAQNSTFSFTRFMSDLPKILMSFYSLAIKKLTTQADLSTKHSNDITPSQAFDAHCLNQNTLNRLSTSKTFLEKKFSPNNPSSFFENPDKPNSQQKFSS